MTVANSLESAPAAGGTGTVTVTTERDCTWAVESDAAWLTIVTGGSGQGSGSAAFRVSPNTQPAARRATLTVNGASLSVAQAAACLFSVTPTSLAAPAEGGPLAVRVDTTGACDWSAAADVDWLRVAAGGRGGQTLTVEIAANRGASRTGRVTVAGQVVTVTQAAVVVATPCAYTVDNSAFSLPASGGTVDVRVTTAATCSWTAASNTSWLSVARNAAGSGASTTTLQAASNTGSARTGTATVAGVTITVTQAGPAPPPPPPPPPPPCAYVLNPTSRTVPALGGTGSFAVSTAAGCTWTARSRAGWITIVGSASGSGPGTVFYAVAPRSGSSRTSTIDVETARFTIIQERTP